LGTTVASPFKAARAAASASTLSDLAPAPAGLAVGPVHLHHLDALSAQVAGQARPVGAGALHAHLHELAERAQPGEKLPIALGSGAEAGRVEDLAPLVDHGGYVDVFVGVHPADDNLRFAWHAGTCPPSLRGWDDTTGRDGGQDSHGALKADAKINA